MFQNLEDGAFQAMNGSNEDLKVFLAEHPEWPADRGAENPRRMKNTLIHLAAYNSDLAKMKILWESLPPLQRKMALNKPNIYGVTPLHEACLNPMPPQIWQQKNPNSEAAAYAKHYQQIMEQKPAMVNWLLEHGADMNAPKAKVNGDVLVDGMILELTPRELVDFNLSKAANDGILAVQTQEKCLQILNSYLLKRQRIQAQGRETGGK